jgi:light-harvesting complex I chlorophyll a/b binding protein 1
MSVSVPFLKRPTKLDGSHAGDVGFDPLGLSEGLDLYTMMEAETRHARLAMLAVVGWPLSELLGPNFMLHGPNHLSPSVLNGFDPLSFIAVAGILGGLGYFEYQTSLRRVDDKPLGIKHKEDMANVWKYGVPGDYNFDPLNLYNMFGDTADGRKAMRELEIGHGRWAMGGITAFAAWEALTGHAIVENSMFFHPNAVLPVLAVAYLSFGFFYEVKNTDTYLLQVESTSEGEVRMERIQRDLGEATAEAAVATKGVRGIIGTGAEIAFDTLKDLNNKYNKVTDDYTKDVMKNIK